MVEEGLPFSIPGALPKDGGGCIFWFKDEGVDTGMVDIELFFGSWIAVWPDDKVEVGSKPARWKPQHLAPIDTSWQERGHRQLVQVLRHSWLEKPEQFWHRLQLLLVSSAFETTEVLDNPFIVLALLLPTIVEVLLLLLFITLLYLLLFFVFRSSLFSLLSIMDIEDVFVLVNRLMS